MRTRVAVKTTWINCWLNSCFHNLTIQATPVFIPLITSARPCLSTIFCLWSFLDCLSSLRFMLVNLTTANCLFIKNLTLNLRFQKRDMERLRDALQLPVHYICSQGTTATGMEALMILLRRLAYPNRWSDLVPVFGRMVSELSLIFNKVNKSVASFIHLCCRSCLYSPYYS